ncbi:MAG: CDP-alcohol phosphatidyltransferase family protein, partial [Actinobacteria bacterium]
MHVVVLQEEELVVDERQVHSGADAGPASHSDHAHDVYTLANIITVLRLILVPIFFAVLLTGTNNTLAFILFTLAASTDWLDGQIARRTGTVTEIGKAIDPLVDRLLIASGVLGLYIEQRIPLWIVLVLLARDLYLLAGASYLAKHRVRALPVIYIGKVTTALLLAGFSGMILDWPMVAGLGVVESAALPGWGSEPVAVWIWLVYAGVVTSLVTAGIYT